MWKFIVVAVFATMTVVAWNMVGPQQPSDTLVIPTASRTAPRGVYASGRVEGWTERIDLRLQLSGRVDQVLVRDGQQVDVGQLLVSQENQHSRHQVTLASAELAAARAQLQRLLNGPTGHELNEAAALYQAKVTEKEHQQLTWERIDQLRQSQAIAGQKADDQRATLERVQSEVAAAKARLEDLKSQPRADEVSIAETRVHAAQARLDVMTTELDRTQLKSPIKGQILRVGVKLGEMAGPSSTEPAVTMADMSRFTVRAFVEELDAPRIRIGLPARITADGLPGKEFQGRVIRLSPMMGPKMIRSDRPDERLDTKTREVWVELTEDTDGLIFGLRVDVLFDLDEPPVSEATGWQHQRKRSVDVNGQGIPEKF